MASIAKLAKKIIVKFGLLNILAIPFYLFRIFKINDHKVFCVNFSGKGYGDSPKYIAEELLKTNANHKTPYKIYWAVSQKRHDFPTSIHQVKIYSPSYFYHLATAKIWINNSRFPIFVRKRKKQFYIQTWHGGNFSLKRIENDARDTLSDYYLKSAPHDSSMIDLMLSGSDFRTQQYQRAFWYAGDVAKFGIPRHDIFFNTDKNELKQRLSERYHFDASAKIILYAPTFRQSQYDYFDIPASKILDAFEKKTKEKYLLLLRLHPRVTTKKRISDPRIIPVSAHPDPDELVLISDLLISDYSSIIADFLFIEKPIYLYAPDQKNYISERGFNFDYTKLPFPIANNQKELLDDILNDKYESCRQKLQEFNASINSYDSGIASRKTVEIIEQLNLESMK